jgi:hypothetical protein
MLRMLAMRSRGGTGRSPEPSLSLGFQDGCSNQSRACGGRKRVRVA